MKNRSKYKRIILLVGIIISLYSCNENSYLLYDGDQINQIYIAQDSVGFVYGPRPDKDVDVMIPVKLIGMVNQNADEAFEIEVDEFESTAILGNHITLSETPRFGKDSTIATLKFNVNKSNLVKNVTYTLYFKIKQTDKFKPTNDKICTLTFGDTYIDQPAWWLPDRLGTYTQEKLVLFIEYFKDTQEATPVIYDAIVLRWGEYLDNVEHNRFQYLLTTYTYTSYFRQYIYTRMYEYYLETGDELYAIPNPELGEYL
ncbi:MAG: DUF4843 domain-containing protein [Marinifilaceae bacterium]